MTSLRTFTFQAKDWRYNSEDEKEENECIITVGGILENGEDIVCEIYGFEPFLVLELPTHLEDEEIDWDEHMYDQIFDWIREMQNERNKFKRPTKYDILTGYKVMQKLRKGSFMRIYYRTHFACICLRSTFESKIDDVWTPKSVYCKVFQKVLPPGAFKLHETNINALLKFIIHKKILPAGWVKVQEYIKESDIGLSVYEKKFTRAKHDCSVRHDQIFPMDHEIEDTVLPDMLVLSFDIECFSKNFNSKMADPLIEENEIYSIGCCLANITSHEDDYKTYILSLENPPDIPNTTMLRYKTERGLLIGFAKFVKKHNPYLFLGHNILGFDWTYMIKRSRLAKNDCYEEFADFSKIIGEEAECTKLSWNSKAYSNMEFRYMNPVGRLNFDLMVEVERQGYRLRSFALNSLGEKFLGEYKKDLPYRHQFIIYFLIKYIRRSKSMKKCKKLIRKVVSEDDSLDPETMELNELGLWKNKLLECTCVIDFRNVMKEGHVLLLEYLRQDVILPMKIFHKMNLWTGAQQAANIFKVPIEYLQTRGQQIKVLAQVYDLATSENIILGFKEYEQKYEWSIQGALVQDIIPGFHKYVLTYDFTSLYPSVIIAFNICYTTVIDRKNYHLYPDAHIIHWEDHRHCGCPGDPRKGKKGKNDKILCSKDENKGTEHEGFFHFRFKKVTTGKDGELIGEGLYPRFLRKLLTKRKAVKKEIKIINKWVFGSDFESKKDRGAITDWAKKAPGCEDGEKGEIVKRYTSYMKKASISKEDLKLIEKSIPKSVTKDVLKGDASLTKSKVFILLIALVVLDKKQLAIKISANSGYGGLGAETSQLCFKPGAACTTAMGRKLITQGIEHTRDNFNSKKLSSIFGREVKEGFQLVYGDTDSFMGCFPSLSIKESWLMIDIIQKELDAGIFPEPIHLEFECMYGKYFQLSKKCYVSWMMEPKNKKVITNDVEKDWIVTEKLQKGVVSSRRDNCRYTTRGFDKVMDMAINQESKEDMRNVVADYAYLIMSKNVPIRDLIITKGVGSLEDYEKEDEEEGTTTLTNQGHIKLAAKMLHLRDEDVQNTRLQFVFIKNPNEKIRFMDLKQEHIIEDATYFKNNFRRLGIEPHYLYYLSHTIITHFDKILDYKDKPETVLCEKIVDRVFKEREYLESKIDHTKVHFLNNLLVPISQTLKVNEKVSLPGSKKSSQCKNISGKGKIDDYFESENKGEEGYKKVSYKLRRQTFLVKNHVEMIAKQVGLEEDELAKYITLLKQKHSENVIKKFQNEYGLTVYGTAKRGDKESNHIAIDGGYTKKLVKAHVRYADVVKHLNKLFVRIEFEDPYMDEDIFE